MILLILYIALLSFYVIGLFVLSIGWSKIDINIFDNDELKINKFSILIPFRNEKGNLKSIITSLINLNYNNTDFEVIFINDNSEDDGDVIVKNLIVEHENFRLINSDESGKKNALTKGVIFSYFDNIVTIDADCIVPKGLLIEYSNKLNLGYDFITGPVVYSNNFILIYELIGLVGIGASSLYFNKPTMANGANLCFKKVKFLELNGYEGNLNIASGDDEFLLQKFQQNKFKLGFLKNSNAIVETNPPFSIYEFLQQRIRWSSKWRGNKGVKLLAPIFLFSLYGLQILLMFKSPLLDVFLFSVLIKILAELIFMYPLLRFYNKVHLIWNVFFVQIYYPFYIVFIGLISLLSKEYKWKGREVK